MSIIVKGMKMPKKCYGYCPACVDTIRGETICNVTQSVIADPDTRNEDCPLVELPPHGRLIDADALEKEPCDVVEIGCWFSECGYSHDQIQNAPTIIEAEEEKDK